jgi:hypothetical protein
MGEASPDWLTKVQIDTLTHNYATNTPKIQQPPLVKDEGAKTRDQSERSSSGQKFLNQRTIKHRLLERLGDLAPV